MVSGVAFELAARGICVEAIAGQPAYHGAGRLPRVIRERGVTVRRVWSTQWDKNRSIGRVVNTATFTASAFGTTLLSRKLGVVVAVTNPPLLPWVARLVRFIRRTPYILLIHDVYPQIAVALGRVRSGSLIDRSWRMLNRLAYRGAAAIIALGECMADVLRAELPPEQAAKVVVIRNWADGERIRPLPRSENPLIAEWGLQDRFAVQYSGNIGLFHEIETLVEAAEKLRGSDIQFIFVGDGGQLPWLRKAVDERPLSNVTLLPFQPKEKLPVTLTACDVGLVTLKKEATGYCVPSKFYGIVAAGKPVIAVMEERCEIAQAVRRHGCGEVVRPGDGEGLANAILRLRGDPARLEQMAKAARQAYEAHYTVEHIAEQYARLLAGILPATVPGGVTGRSSAAAKFPDV